jgi:hypothetical protein
MRDVTEVIAVKGEKNRVDPQFFLEQGGTAGGLRKLPVP